MSEILEPLLYSRAVKAFEPVEIPQVLREQILDAARHAPSSFNMQPYRLFWWNRHPERQRRRNLHGADATVTLV